MVSENQIVTVFYLIDCTTVAQLCYHIHLRGWMSLYHRQLSNTLPVCPCCHKKKTARLYAIPNSGDSYILHKFNMYGLLSCRMVLSLLEPIRSKNRIYIIFIRQHLGIYEKPVFLDRKCIFP
ncbi:hypothetical protein Barb6_00144 [Bacteroidales bacterium Barb6]|nr:hypothetical protein Barb6_00177 [Bacteroidales bacterium Barb6]OAV73539.1 hypothetical protein Barb6_00144 [Bacteroidales bacterium Barb6]